MEERKEFSMADGIIVLIWLPLSFALMYAIALLLADGAAFADRMLFTYYVLTTWIDSITFSKEGVMQLGVGLGVLFAGVSCVGAFRRYENAKINIEEQVWAMDVVEEKRQLELETAFEAIELFNDARVALEMVRSPVILKEEIEELEAVDEACDLGKKLKKDKTAAAVVLLRLEEGVEIFAALKSLKPVFVAMFDTKAPFDKFETLVADVKESAMAILDGKSDKKDAGVIIQASANDDTSKKMDDIVGKVEKLCIPVIRG